jgi:putative ABC transport system substrate-binding protein
MQRRRLIGLIGGAVVWPVMARAQSKRTRRVGVLLASNERDPEMQARLSAFQAALRALGWTIGDNVEMDVRWFGGSSERAEEYAREIAALAPDIIVANATVGIQAVLKTTRNVPTVFVTVGNPVDSGFVASMSRPGANVTGFSAFEPEITGRWIQLLKEVAPRTRHIGVLSYPGYEFLWEKAEAAAAALSVTVTRTVANNAAEIEQVMAAIAGRPDGA